MLVYGRISLKVELVDGAKPMDRKYAEAGVHLIRTTQEISNHRTGQHLKPVSMETRNSYWLFFLASTAQSLDPLCPPFLLWQLRKQPPINL